jgi:hypothetical protein
MSRYKIPVMVEGAINVHLYAVTNMFQGGTWIFAATNPAVTPERERERE